MNESIDYFVPQFCCDFYSNNNLENICFDEKQNSYLKQNQLKWLFNKNNNYCNYWSNRESIRLFELNINSNDLTSNQIKVLFTFVKKYLNELRSDSMTRSGINRNGCNSDNRELRHKISTFLTYLKRRLFEICVQSNQSDVDQIMPNNENSFCVLVIKQIKSLLLFVGRLSQMRPQLVRLAISSEPKTWIYNYFHSCLDIWWTAIELTYILDQNNKINLNDCSLVKEDMGSGAQLCPQTIRLVLFDLIALSVNRFNETKMSNKCISLSVFDCLCVKEMFVLVRHTFNTINNTDTTDQFSELIFSTLNSLTNLSSTQSQSITDLKTICLPNICIEKPLLHFIWFSTNIVQIFNYDMSGKLCQQQSSADPIPTALLKKITFILKQNDSTVNECELSAIILFCLKSVSFWKPNTDLLLPFTEYFLKNINHSFGRMSVEELPIIPKSSDKWSQLIRDISIFNDRNNIFMENSFNLFLSLMSQQLVRVFDKCEPKARLQNWLKFKGKCLANLQSKKLDKIDGIGTFNLLSFYLVLINTNHEIWTDIIDKIFETINELLNKNISNRLELILKFMFTSINIKPKSISDEKISFFIGKTFNKLCEQRVKNLDSNSFNKCFVNLTTIYFNELKLLMKSHLFSKLSFDKLLNINFGVFSCAYIKPDEQSVVIHLISFLLIQINETIELREQELEINLILVINTCFDAILPFVKQEITQKNNNNKGLAEIAFNFTKLSNSMSLLNRNENFSILFNDIINICRNNSEFLCNYLCLVLENSNCIQSLRRESSQISSTLISIWCRLLVSPEMSQLLVDSLSYHLSEIIDELRCDEPIDETTNKSSAVFEVFLKNLMEKLVNSSVSDRTQVIQSAHKYLNDMITTSEVVIKQNSFSLTIVKRIYKLISSLVSIASPLLYVPYKPDCLLLKIMNSIVLPKHLSNELKLQLNSIFQKAFPSFIEGLCKLQYSGDRFLERQIRQTISFYLPLIVNRSNAFILLKNEFESRNVCTDWSKLLLQTIVNNILSKTESSLSPLSPTLIQFVDDFCNSDLTEDQLLAVLVQALEVVIVVDIRSKDSLLSLISSITKIFCEQQKHKVLFDRVFDNFIETHLSNKSSLKRLFEVIKFVTDCRPHLFHDFVGQINRSIESIEKKRNIGTDLILRNGLREFANHRQNPFSL